jgi:hypothetical protein
MVEWFVSIKFKTNVYWSDRGLVVDRNPERGCKDEGKPLSRSRFESETLWTWSAKAYRTAVFGYKYKYLNTLFDFQYSLFCPYTVYMCITWVSQEQAVSQHKWQTRLYDYYNSDQQMNKIFIKITTLF